MNEKKQLARLFKEYEINPNLTKREIQNALKILNKWQVRELIEAIKRDVTKRFYEVLKQE